MLKYDPGSKETRSPSPGGNVRMREIAGTDLSALATFLAHGFKRSKREDWLQIFDRLSKHPTPVGGPQYGYLMESECVPVGAIIVISAVTHSGGVSTIRSNLSSWYVLPAFRSFAPFFVARILRNKDATYVNVSPAPHTLPILDAQGFLRYSAGQLFLPASPFASSGDAHISVVAPGSVIAPELEASERDLLLAHAGYGCTSLVCGTRDGVYPFVFRYRRVKRLLPCAQLIYCRNINDLVRFFTPIGRFLARNGTPIIVVDSSQPIRGLRGMHVGEISPKYYRGPAAPRIGDLAYTETAMFGV